jgi:hypothetical protein
VAFPAPFRETVRETPRLNVVLAQCGVMIRQQILGGLTQDAARAARHVALQIGTALESTPIPSVSGDSDLIQVVRADGDVTVDPEGRTAMSTTRPAPGDSWVDFTAYPPQLDRCVRMVGVLVDTSCTGWS